MNASTHDTVAATLAEFVQIGLATPADPAAIVAKIDQVWGAELDEITDTQAGVDLVVLTSCEAPVFTVASDDYSPGIDGYVSLLNACAAAVPSALTIESATETWIGDDCVVSFVANGVPARANVARKYIDTSILTAVNAVVADGNGFWACDALGMPNVICFLTPAQRDIVVADRGWFLQPAPPGPTAAAPATPPAAPDGDPPPKRSKWWRR